MVILSIIGLVIVVLLSCIIAFILSREETASRMDKDFQIWAFGEILPEDMPLSQVPYLWNKKNPENKMVICNDFKKSINKMVDLYKQHKKRSPKNNKKGGFRSRFTFFRF